MPSLPSRGPAPRTPVHDRESGVALILVLIFTVLLYALIADLVTSARTARLTGEGDAILDRMSNHMDFSMVEVETMLLEDLVAASAGGEGEEEGGGGLPGLEGAAPPSGGGAEGGGEGDEEEEEDPAAVADGSQDGWFEPTSYSDEEITTYVWIEDENRKFNIYTLVSADEEFAEESKRRFARIVDRLRDRTEFDLTEADGVAIAEALIEWMKSNGRSELMPRPGLKSDDEESGRQDITLLLHLDEMMMLRNVDAELFYDKVLDGRVIPGLESVFTCYTSQAWDPGDPDDPREAARQQPDEQGDPGAADPNAIEGGDANGATPSGPTPIGLGIAININTALPSVLYGLAGQDIPDAAIEAILRWRNEEIEEDPDEVGSDTLQNYTGDVDFGESVRRQVFTDLSQLDDIDEWENIADEDAKQEFLGLLTTKSDVFTVHMASMVRKNEEERTFVLRRASSVVMRLDNGEDGYLHPLMPRKQRHGLRVVGVDFPDDVGDRFRLFDEMDSFTREERSWNPFYVEFYLPPEERERIFGY